MAGSHQEKTFLAVSVTAFERFGWPERPIVEGVKQNLRSLELASEREPKGYWLGGRFRGISRQRPSWEIGPKIVGCLRWSAGLVFLFASLAFLKSLRFTEGYLSFPTDLGPGGNAKDNQQGSLYSLT